MTSQALKEAAIACTLGTEEFKVRLESIAQLNSAALRSYRRNDLGLELIYDAKARTRVLEMIASEEACCAFLASKMRHTRDTIQVIIRAPESVRAAAETVFEPFLSKTPAQATGCACCGPSL